VTEAPAGARSLREGVGRTFIEGARRAQVVAAAIDAFADLGYAAASLARIAEYAGTSKGVVTYHFEGREDLVRAVYAEVLARAESRARTASSHTSPSAWTSPATALASCSCRRLCGRHAKRRHRVART
jgi:AcrR family transcriptional regulator